MAEPEFRFVTGEDFRVLLTRGLRVAFSRDGDRWSHLLSTEQGYSLLPTVVLAATLEGNPTRDDPGRVVSPTYQEVQPHIDDSGFHMLMTGLSFPHHFSAVVTARGDGASTVVEVDIADRCRAPIEVLAATYLVPLVSSNLVDASAERIVWGGDALGGGRLEFTAPGGADVVLAEAGRRASRVQALARLSPTTCTHRLFYAWRWTPPL
jgi:hypothetical protein